jgi:hypothetical protein
MLWLRVEDMGLRWLQAQGQRILILMHHGIFDQGSGWKHRPLTSCEKAFARRESTSTITVPNVPNGLVAMGEKW